MLKVRKGKIDGEGIGLGTQDIKIIGGKR